VVSVTDPTVTPQKHYYFNVSGTHFCWRLSKPQGLVRLEGLGYEVSLLSMCLTIYIYVYVSPYTGSTQPREYIE
jgi:hypothetical protein